MEQIRETLLKLHKALLEAQRVAYEQAHGPLESTGAFLQLAAYDPAFAWLRPYLTLIIDIDTNKVTEAEARQRYEALAEAPELRALMGWGEPAAPAVA